VSRAQATGTLLTETERVKVWRWDFAPGAETGWHRHGHDYVVTALTRLDMLLEEPAGGARRVEIAAGTVYTRPAGVEHNVVNAGNESMSFVEVELK
jgi:quercetin dioxygenase-like cupin family protein